VIVYSAEAEPARAYLLRNYNDLDVYVEDANCQHMYIRLVNRILEPHGKHISSVFPLHGRRNLLTRCSADQAVRVGKRIYILDGDLELLLGRAVPPLRHLYRLEAYCAENLLLSEHAIVTIATECDTNKPWHQMALDLALKNLLDRSVLILLPLFVVYAIIYHLGLPIVTVNFSVHRLLEREHDPLSLSARLVRSRIVSLIREIRSQVSPADYRRAREAAKINLQNERQDRSVFISAKDYLIPLVHMHLRHVANMRDPIDALKVRLALHCELDPSLSRSIISALN